MGCVWFFITLCIFQHPDAQHHSFSLSDDSESVHRPVFIKPAQHTTGNRMSPGSLQRKLTAEINRLETVEDSVRQVADIDKARAVSLAQQETVSFAQFLKVGRSCFLPFFLFIQLMHPMAFLVRNFPKSVYFLSGPTTKSRTTDTKLKAQSQRRSHPSCERS